MGKVRVHQLAKELKITSSQLLATLSEDGISAASASATLEAPIVRKLREHYGASSVSNNAKRKPAPDPQYILVQDSASSEVHHWDYIDRSDERALCGYRYVARAARAEISDAGNVCQRCEERIATYHARWWREQFEKCNAELEELRAMYGKLERHCAEQKSHLATLNAKVKQARSQSKATVKRKPKKVAVRLVKKTAVRTKTSRARHVSPAFGERSESARVARKWHNDPRAPKPKGGFVNNGSDEAARERMRSHKPSTWRVGKSPSSYR